MQCSITERHSLTSEDSGRLQSPSPAKIRALPRARSVLRWSPTRSTHSSIDAAAGGCRHGLKALTRSRLITTVT